MVKLIRMNNATKSYPAFLEEPTSALLTQLTSHFTRPSWVTPLSCRGQVNQVTQELLSARALRRRTANRNGARRTRGVVVGRNGRKVNN